MDRDAIVKEIKANLDFDFYGNTEGAYIIKGDGNIALAYRYSDDIEQIDVDGENLFVSYLEGSMRFLLSFVSNDVRMIAFERDCDGKIRFYDFKRFKSKFLS